MSGSDVFGRARRNSGRSLAVAIESSASVDLNGLLGRTADLMVRSGVVARRPTFPRAETLQVSGELLAAVDGEWLSLHRFDEFDLLTGVMSRAKRAAGMWAENRAVAVLLGVLTTRSPEGVVYGTLLSERMDRLSRTREGEAARTAVLKDWDIRRVDETGVNDPLGNPAFDVVEMMGGYQSELEVAHTKSKTTAEKQAAFERGVSKFARSKTSPLVRVRPGSGAMSWDLDVVAAVREAAVLLSSGATWAMAAAEVGLRIPAYALTDESDEVRAARNVRLRQLGRPEVPLHYDEAGRENPARRQETIADALYPELLLRRYLLREGQQLGKREACEKFLFEDLEGLNERAVRRGLLVDGVYMRRVVDLFKSNSSMERYRLIRFDLGPVEVSGGGERRGVLTPEQFDKVWPIKDGEIWARNGRTGFGLLKGAFRVVSPERVFSHAGWLDAAEGQWRFRVRSDPDVGRRRSYSVQFEPLSKPVGVGYVTLGLTGVGVLQASVRDAIVGLLDAPGVLPVNAEWVVRARSAQGDLSMLRRGLEEAKSRLRKALSDSSQEGLSEERAEAFETIVADREGVVTELRAELARREAAADEVKAVSGVWAVGHTVDLLAALGLTRKLDGFATKAIQVAVRDVVRDGRIWLDPVEGSIRWSAKFTLTNAEGAVVEHPISGSVPNEARSVWVRRCWETRWWAAATGSGDAEIGPGRSEVTRSARGRMHDGPVERVEARVKGEAADAGVKLRANAAYAVVLCPDWGLTRLALRVVLGLPVEESARVAWLRAALLVDDAGERGPFDVARRLTDWAWRVSLPELGVAALAERLVASDIEPC